MVHLQAHVSRTPALFQSFAGVVEVGEVEAVATSEGCVDVVGVGVVVEVELALPSHLCGRPPVIGCCTTSGLSWFGDTGGLCGFERRGLRGSRCVHGARRR